MNQYTDEPIHRCTAEQIHRCASTVATMEYHDSLCLPNIYSFTNFFVGQLFDAKEVFTSFKSPVLTRIFEPPSLLTAFEALQLASFFRALVQDLPSRQGKNHLPQLFSEPSRGTNHEASSSLK